MINKNNVKNEKDYCCIMEQVWEQVCIFEVLWVVVGDNGKFQVLIINVLGIVVKDFNFDFEDQQVDFEVLRKMFFNISFFEGGILFYFVFVGIIVFFIIEGYLIFVIVIVFYQMFEGLGFGFCIVEVFYFKGSWWLWIFVFVFGIMVFFGMGFGIVFNGIYDFDSVFGLILVGCFNVL